MISDIVPLSKALGKCFYACEFFSAMNGIVICHIVPLGKCLCVCEFFSVVNGIVISHIASLGNCVYICQFFSAMNGIAIGIVMSHILCVGKCLYVCEFFSMLNGMAIEIVKSHMVFVGKCLKVCNSFSVNVLVIGIVILGNVLSAQYLMNKIRSTCDCDCLWLLNVMVFAICNALCLCEYPLNQLNVIMICNAL